MTGVFAAWQPRYAERGVATFPVAAKKPAVRGYLRLGIRGSTRLVPKFAELDGIGFAVGKRSGITVLDVDTPDERVLQDALDRYGSTPLVIRSGSGNFQAWYRWNGERRYIRPDRDPEWPVDILGNGFVVAPPSSGTKAQYEFLQGNLDDLRRLPTLRAPICKARPDVAEFAGQQRLAVTVGNRNKTLWEHCMRAAHCCDGVDALLDVARTRNAEFSPPLNDDEVIKVAASAWQYTEAGKNQFGRHAAVLFQEHVDSLIHDPDVLALVAWLKAHNRPDAQFWVADGLAPQIGWSLHQLREARKRAVAMGEIKKVKPSWPGAPAEYVFGKTSGIQR